MEAPDERDDDRRETVAGRHRRQELSDWTGDFAHARDARACAADQHSQPHHAIGVETGVFRGVGGEPRDAQLIAQEAPVQKHVAECDRRERNDEAEIEPRPVDQDRIERRIGELLRLRKVEPLRVAPGLVHKPREQQIGDIDEHQAHQDLVGVEARAQERRDRCPQHAALDTTYQGTDS